MLRNVRGEKINNNINDSTLLDLIYNDNSQVARKAGRVMGEGRMAPSNRPDRILLYFLSPVDRRIVNK